MRELMFQLRTTWCCWMLLKVGLDDVHITIYPIKIWNHDIKHPNKSHDLYESPMKSGWIWSFTSLKIAEMRAFADDSPNPNHHSKIRSQWGHYNLPCHPPGLEDEFPIQTHELSTNRGWAATSHWKIAYFQGLYEFTRGYHPISIPSGKLT